LNQNDLIQRILATEQQAKALTAEARTAKENLESNMDAEIEALRQKYQQEGEEYLETLRQQEHEKSRSHLEDLDARLQAKLSQVENIYQSQKDTWVDAIFARIVGKAGS
jgi:molybdopterin converting factor small subunit